MGLQDIGFTEPTPIQEKSIPLILSGQDVLGAAQTGTGKTGAFVIPILNQILSEPKEGTKALILSPTRELAQQIDEQIFALGYHTGLSSSTIIGGEDFARQAEAIRAGVDLIVATPGRLIDQMKVLDVDFTNIKYLILDEADRMLDMGFLPDVNHIIDKLPKERQTLLFSATMPKEIQHLAKKIQKNPELIQIEMSKPSNSVAQRAYQVDGREKLKLTQRLLDELEWTSCIIFTATKRGTDQLERLLSKKGINAASIHGDRDQDERTKALNSFKNGKVPIIVATDVLARGIDIADVSLIINYDVPHAVDDYIHRIGRTGRYDKSGMAVTLVSKKDAKLFKPIKQKAGKDLEIIDGDALLKSESSSDGRQNDAKSSKSKSNKKKSDTNKNESDKNVEAKSASNSSSDKKGSAKDITPDFSNAKTINVSKSEQGGFVIELKNKPADEKKQEEKTVSVKLPKKESKSNSKKKAVSKKSNSKKQPKQKAAKQSKQPKKTIELKTIDKAAERNKNAHKPAKGIWGLIKSFLPKF
jgi:superfamily II DNA/RNA helicase